MLVNSICEYHEINIVVVPVIKMGTNKQEKT